MIGSTPPTNGNFWLNRPTRSSGGNGSSNLGAATRLLVQTADLKKDRQDYRPVAYGAGPTGEVYVAYQSRQNTYLARVEPDGDVAWEAPTPFTTISSLNVSPDGVTVLLKNQDGLICFGSDGQVRSRIEFPRKVYSEVRQASNGNVYVSSDGKLEAYNSAGQPVEVDSPERAQPPVATPEGGVMTRSGNELVRLDASGDEIGRLTLKTRPNQGKASYHHGRFWPLEGGDVMVEETQSIELSGRHAFRMGYRGGFQDPDHWAPQYATTARLQRLAPDGSLRWETDHLGDSPKVYVTPKGTIYWEIGQGKIQRRDQNGFENFDFGPKATMNGRLVRHEEGVTRLGDPSATIAVPKNDYELRGETPDGRLLFEDKGKRELYSFDDKRGFVRLTDRHLEYTSRLPTDQAEEHGGVHVGEDYVTVNGVRVRVRD